MVAEIDADRSQQHLASSRPARLTGKPLGGLYGRIEVSLLNQHPRHLVQQRGRDHAWALATVLDEGRVPRFQGRLELFESKVSPAQQGAILGFDQFLINTSVVDQGRVIQALPCGTAGDEPGSDRVRGMGLHPGSGLRLRLFPVTPLIGARSGLERIGPQPGPGTEANRDDGAGEESQREALAGSDELTRGYQNLPPSWAPSFDPRQASPWS